MMTTNVLAAVFVVVAAVVLRKMRILGLETSRSHGRGEGPE
jgi:hypothetical protein